MYTCEKCLKYVTVKFASGRFCSKSCANGRKHSTSEIKNISKGIRNSEAYKNKSMFRTGNRVARKIISCLTCNKQITTKTNSKAKFCSLKCSWKNPKLGGARLGSGHSKTGWYKNIYCGSSWELAFLIWALDHNLPIKRCNNVYKYSYMSTIKNYHPDFSINQFDIEIKGYETTQSKEKRIQTPSVITLFKSDLESVFSYVKSKHGKNFVSLLEKKTYK